MLHLPQVRAIARRIHDRLPPHVDVEDLEHAGVLGLIEALEKFDPRKGVELKTYAKYRVQGAILDHLRHLDWSPRALRRKARELERALDLLRARLGRQPNECEVAAELGVTLQRLQRLKRDLRGLELRSLTQEEPPDDPGEPNGCDLSGLASSEDPYRACLRGEVRALLARALGELPPRGRQVFLLYYFGGLKMSDVARKLGVCEARVSQIHSAALAPLRLRLGQLLGPVRP